MTPGSETARPNTPVSFRDPVAAARTLERIRQRVSNPVAEGICALLGDVPDPDSAVNLLERLVSGPNPEFVQVLDRSRELIHYALAVFGHSQFLGETLLHNPDLLLSLRREGALDRSRSREEFREYFARLRSRSFDSDISLLLARFKRREYVRIMLRDVLGIATLAETTAEISALADVVIEEALREAESALRERYGVPKHKDSAGRLVDTTCAVLALGKLGGNELNYSSDIDLLFVYDDAEDAGQAAIPSREWFVRLGQQVTQILSRMTREGFGFRVDLRLRPQGGEGEPAVGLRQAMRYYAHTAQDWERQAMIKVRPSAGDVSLARTFIRGVQPYVYTEQVNFSAIETALETRDRISSRRRASTRAGTIDVKLDRGGIRDIEFLVQCLQRVYGGKEPWLRSGGTLFSLAKLHDKGHISGKDFHELTSAYEFLRTVEHRLQLRQGQQTHRLPQSETDLQVLARAVGPALAGELSANAVVETVRQRMAAVSEIYTRIIHQQQWQQEREVREFHLESSVAAPGPERSDRQLLERLAQDAPALHALAVREDLPAYTRRNLLRFLTAAYTSSERYAAVLRASGDVERALELFRLSEFLTDLLLRYPEEITTLEHIETTAFSAGGDALFPPTSQPGNGRDPVFAWVGSASGGFGEKLALLRRHYRHRLFRSGARDVLQGRNVYESLAETSAAADEAISAALAIAGNPDGFAVLALGRLGTYEFDLLSDADLVFVREASLDAASAQRCAQQIVQALSAYTREGTVFPVDARLRPRGGEGELVMTAQQLESYFRQEAQPWEALTFTKLRPVAGAAEAAQQAMASVHVLIERFAGDPAFIAAVREMRARLENADRTAGARLEASERENFKSGPGGIYDVDFLVATLLVRYGVERASGNLRERLCDLQRRNLLSAADANQMLEAAQFLRALEHAVRLVTGRTRKSLPAAEGARQAVAELTARFLNREQRLDLPAELAGVQSSLRALYDRILDAEQMQAPIAPPESR